MSQSNLIYGGKLPFVEPLTEERAAYNEVLAMYESEGAFDPDHYSGPPLAPFASSLRSDLVMTGNLAAPNVLQWNFRTNQVNPGMSFVGGADNRLDDNDAFMVREVGLLFGIVADDQPISSAVLRQVDNPLALASGGFGAANGAVIRTQNGTMDLEVNAVKFMEGLDCLNFRYAGSAQVGQAVSDVATTGITNANSFDGRRGWKSLTPQMRFSGSDKTEFRVNVKDPASFAVAGFSIVASLQLRGLRIQNGGKFVPRTR